MTRIFSPAAVLSSLPLPFCLFADGVCLIDPEYLKDRKGTKGQGQKL